MNFSSLLLNTSGHFRSKINNSLKFLDTPILNYLLVSDILERIQYARVYMTVGILITLYTCALKTATIFGTDSEVQFWIS